LDFSGIIFLDITEDELMSLMEKIGKFSEQSVFKKLLVYGVSGLVIFIIVCEIFFWSIFNHVMSEVKTQNEAVQKRQAAIMEQAQQMQNKMDAKINNFQSSMKQQASKIQNNVDDFNNGAVKAESNFENSGNEFELRTKINDQIMNDSIEASHVDNIRHDAVSNHDNSKKYLELSSDEQKVVMNLIAEYRTAHPTLMEIPGAATPLKLSPQDQVALIEMIRAYNNKKLRKEEWVANAGDRQILKDTSIENFDKSRQKFNNAVKDTLDDIHKTNQEISQDSP
jgi:hypothetical protein